MAIGSHKLVDASTTTEAPFTIEEIKNAKGLAEGLLIVYGRRHSIEELIRETRLSAEKARRQAKDLSNPPVQPN